MSERSAKDCKDGITGEPMASESIKAGADVVLLSGDKLMGGPQCGLIVGRKGLVQQIARHPMNRALRVDKMTLAALAATLRLYRDQDTAEQTIPLLMLLNTPVENLKNRAERLAPQMAAAAAVASAASGMTCKKRPPAPATSPSGVNLTLKLKAVGICSEVR